MGPSSGLTNVNISSKRGSPASLVLVSVKSLLIRMLLRLFYVLILVFSLRVNEVHNFLLMMPHVEVLSNPFEVLLS